MHVGQWSIGGVIVVDTGRSRSTCLRHGAYIHDHYHEYVITMHFSINCPTVICSPTICYVFEREASSENYGPGVYFNPIIKTNIPLLQFYFFYFVLQFIHPPIQNLILASNELKEIDNPLVRVGCKYLLLCVQVLFMRLCVILLLVR